MKKIISLFQRNYDGDRLVRDEIVPGAEWVVNGEGWATRKYDGTCCMVRGGVLFKRYDHKPDNWKAIQQSIKYGRVVPAPIFSPPPAGFEAAQEPDKVTMHWPGWLPVGSGPDDQWHRQAFHGDEIDGTYELCGPRLQGNPEKFERHALVAHALAEKLDAPRTFEGLKDWFVGKDIEGVVWHHPDGRMVKIKKRDFGLKRLEGVSGAGEK